MTDLAISVRLNADGTALVNGVRPARTEIDALKTSAKAAGNEIDALAAGTGKTAKTSGEMFTEISKVASGLKTAGERAKFFRTETDKAMAGIAAKMPGASLLASRLSNAWKDANDQAMRDDFSKAAARARELAESLKKTKPEADGLARAALRAATSVARLAGATKVASAVDAASNISRMAGASQLASRALGALLSPVGLATAAVATLGLSFYAAYQYADAYLLRTQALSDAIGRAGQQYSVTADGLRSSATRIAAETGQAYDVILAASTKLTAANRNTASEVHILTEAGAKLAATFGGDVGTATDDVANAFNALGEGDVAALDQRFGFLSATVRDHIVQLDAAGKRAEAQRALMQALAETTHGGPGSLSNAYDNATTAVGDLVGAWLNSSGPIQKVRGWLSDLAQVAGTAAERIRDAAGAAPGTPASAAVGVPGAGARTTPADLARIQRGKFDREVADAKVPQRERAFNNDFNRAVTEATRNGIRDQKVLTELATRYATQMQAVRDAAEAAGKHHKAAVPHAKAVSEALREAERAAKALDGDLDSVIDAFDPLQASANKYGDALDRIARLKAAGRITPSQAQDFTFAAGDEATAAQSKIKADLTAKAFGYTSADAWNDAIRADLEGPVKTAMERAGLAGGKAFRDEGTAAAQAIAQVLGGEIGGAASKLIGLARGAQTGDFTSVGGRLGGALTLASGGLTPEDGSFANGFASGAGEFWDDGKTVLTSVFDSVFKAGGIFSEGLGKTIGGALAGAGVGQAAGSLLGSKGSSTGGAIGGAIGKFAGAAIGKAVGGALGGAIGGPLGSALGGILGSALGGLLKKTQKGSAAVELSDGTLAVGSAAGNSASFKKAATGLAGNVISGIQTVAEQLGGIVGGKIAVSLGVRNGQPVVDTTGKNRTKGSGVVKFDKGDEAGATAFAIADAIADGAIVGITAKVSAALASSTDIDKALREALKVDAIEQLLDGFGGSTKKAFVDFERQARDRLRIATKYGFDLVKIEEITAKDRAKLLTASIDTATGGLKSLLEDLLTGERSAGTLEERRLALIAKAEALRPDAATDSDAASKLADILGQIEQISLDANGSAGAQYVADRNFVKSTAQSIIDQATTDITAAQDRARVNAGTDPASTEALIDKGNKLLADMASSLDDNYDQNARIIALLGTIAGANLRPTADNAAILAQAAAIGRSALV